MKCWKCNERYYPSDSYRLARVYTAYICVPCLNEFEVFLYTENSIQLETWECIQEADIYRQGCTPNVDKARLSIQAESALRRKLFAMCEEWCPMPVREEPKP